jgi:hypothetical protein
VQVTRSEISAEMGVAVGVGAGVNDEAVNLEEVVSFAARQPKAEGIVKEFNGMTHTDFVIVT